MNSEDSLQLVVLTIYASESEYLLLDEAECNANCIWWIKDGLTAYSISGCWVAIATTCQINFPWCRDVKSSSGSVFFRTSATVCTPARFIHARLAGEIRPRRSTCGKLCAPNGIVCGRLQRKTCHLFVPKTQVPMYMFGMFGKICMTQLMVYNEDGVHEVIYSSDTSKLGVRVWYSTSPAPLARDVRNAHTNTNRKTDTTFSHTIAC